MNQTGRFLIVATLAGVLVPPAILAQSAQSAQNPQSQLNQDQYTGVAHPPPDDTIQADEDVNPAPAPRPAPAAKPSAAIPVTAPATAPAAKPAPAAAPEDDGIVTSAAPAKTSTVPSADSFDNTDYGIVTSVPAPQAQKDEEMNDDSTVSLKSRHAWNPDDHIVNVVPSDPNALNSGTNITVRLLQDLSTTKTEEGSAFRASVIRNVYKAGSVIIPAGSEMHGRVVFVSQGHHIGSQSTLRLRPDYIILPDHTAYHLYAEVVASYAPGTRINDEGGIQASPHYGKEAVEYGGGVGAGAVAGAAIAGPVGAGVGSLVGAGLVTTHLLIQPPRQTDLPTGSELVFSLTEPMPLTPAKN
jgi:hypothetical protein